MFRDKLFIALFVLIAFIALLHGFAVEYHLYWMFWWFDILVHFLSGLWVSLFSLWFYFRSGLFEGPTQNIWSASLLSISSVIVIGAAWELYEIIIGAHLGESYVTDTIFDLVMDVLGALTGLIYYVRVYLTSNTDNTKNGT